MEKPDLKIINQKGHMKIEWVGKEARKKLALEIKAISKDIGIKTINIKGYIEPKNVEFYFQHINIVDKLKAIRTVKEFLPKFRADCFNANI